MSASVSSIPRQLTETHIRYATGTQLAVLLGVTPQAVAAWTVGRHNVSGYILARAAARGIAKEVLIRGLDQRCQDAQNARKYQSEVASYMESVEQGAA